MLVKNPLTKPSGDKIYCVYKITNLDNGKIYIGQTVNFRKRVNDYVNSDTKKHSQMHSIISFIGSEHFSIEILKECDEDDLTYYEDYYIEKLKANDPEYGYNKVIGNGNANTRASRMAKSLGHIGLKESNDTKRKKSNKVIAVSEEEKTIIIADSGALLGTYFGKGKDYIKNCLRQPSSINGYSLYYSDFFKRDEIRVKMEAKRSIRNPIYMKILKLLNDIEFEVEGVETIDLLFSVYLLSYDNEINTETGKPELVKVLGRDYFAG